MKIRLVVIFISLSIFFGCKSKTNLEGGSKDASYESRSMVSEMEVSKDLAAPEFVQQNEITNADKKIIKTAFISMEVANYESSRKKLGHMLTNHKAYIISENLQNSNEMMSNSINIRVPAELFDRLIAEISKIAKRIDFQNIDSQDITEEYMDIESRLKNKKKVEQSFVKLLRKADSVDDILKIENKLGEIRGEIESAEGRLKFIKHQVEFSTINLTLYQKQEYTYQSEDSPKFFQRLKKALDSGWKATISFLLFILKIWPFWIILSITYITWQYIKYIRSIRKKEKKRKRKEQKLEHKAQISSQQNP